MSFLSQISFDDILCSVLVCIALREVMIFAPPGPARKPDSTPRRSAPGLIDRNR